MKAPQKFYDDLRKRVASYVASCNLIKPEKITEFIDLIVYEAFNEGGLLSADEKRQLGLNVRGKYAKVLINCFAVDNFDFDPKQFAKNLRDTQASLIGALNQINNYRADPIKVFSKVRTEGNDEWDNGIFSLDDIPLPKHPDYKTNRVIYFITPVFENNSAVGNARVNIDKEKMREIRQNLENVLRDKLANISEKRSHQIQEEMIEESIKQAKQKSMLRRLFEKAFGQE